ncbi:MAG: hypothetical protein HGA23_11655, partial [Bacteroidales bacterium]|nr:hypothetical protein [Bacteroidales bacterium]
MEKNLNNNTFISGFLVENPSTVPGDIREKQLKVLRRDDVNVPVIFIGTGTCGLGAGAGKTKQTAQEYLTRHGIDATIIDVGCIGLCSSEPILDIQLPGTKRISFEKVTADKVENILDKIFYNELPEHPLLGQFSQGDGKAWDGVPLMDEHPFFAPQTRVVLQNCGIIDPSSIEEYIAFGGYQTLVRTLQTNSAKEVCNIAEESGL